MFSFRSVTVGVYLAVVGRMALTLYIPEDVHAFSQTDPSTSVTYLPRHRALFVHVTDSSSFGSR